MVFDFVKKLRRLKLPRLRVPNIFIVLPGYSGHDDLNSDSDPGLPEIDYPPALVLDTSVIIDGRIADIVSTGFVSGTLVVPSCVLQELQHIADSRVRLKRNRGRRGLEVLEALKKAEGVGFAMVDCHPAEGEEIDVAVLNLARKLKGKVVTTDYNLNKIAKVSGVPILNVNELANMVKTVVLPGERLMVKIIQEGKEEQQGVGYLPDGTMVVVEKGAKKIGKEIEVEVRRLLQTEAGRMIFAEQVRN